MRCLKGNIPMISSLIRTSFLLDIGIDFSVGSKDPVKHFVVSRKESP